MAWRWLMCCDAIEHWLKLVSEQSGHKELERGLWGGLPIPCGQKRAGDPQRLCSLLHIGVLPSHMVPIVSVRYFLPLKWTLAIWPNRLTAFASMLVVKMVAVGLLDSHLSSEATGTEQPTGNHFQNAMEVDITDGPRSLVRRECGRQTEWLENCFPFSGLERCFCLV